MWPAILIISWIIFFLYLLFSWREIKENKKLLKNSNVLLNTWKKKYRDKLPECSRDQLEDLQWLTEQIWNDSRKLLEIYDSLRELCDQCDEFLEEKEVSI